MNPDYLVGALSVAIGFFLLCAAALNWEPFFKTKRPAWFVQTLGRGKARVFFVILGLSLTLLGVVIALGWTQPT